jgi:hypothetical protein
MDLKINRKLIEQTTYFGKLEKTISGGYTAIPFSYSTPALYLGTGVYAFSRTFMNNAFYLRSQ